MLVYWSVAWDQDPCNDVLEKIFHYVARTARKCPTVGVHRPTNCGQTGIRAGYASFAGDGPHEAALPQTMVRSEAWD